MSQLDKLVSQVKSSLPEDIQGRIAERLQAFIAEEADALEAQAKALRRVANGAASAERPRKSNGSKAVTVKPHLRARKRLQESDYQEIRDALVGELVKGKTYPRNVLVNKVAAMGYPVKEATFTGKVLDPLCEADRLEWNGQKRGRAYTRC